MLRKVDKIYVGKDVTSTLVPGDDMAAIQAGILEGEIVILNEEYKVADLAATYQNTRKIYIAEGTSEIFDTVNPDGTALSGRRLLISAEIDGNQVVNYSGKDYEAKAEATVTMPAIADTIIPGTEYVLRVVYKGDIATQYPGQNVDKFRYISVTGDDSSAVYDALVAEVNKRYINPRIRGAQQVIRAANNAGSLVLTGLPVRSCTTSVDDIDEFVMNSMTAVLNYVDNDYRQSSVALSGPIVTVNAFRGNGTWETIRDVEKHAQSYQGITNRTCFPVIKPHMRTVKGIEYNTITIEHDREYRSADNQYDKKTSLVETIALDNANTGTLETSVLTTLNSWMASTPKAFSAVAFA